MLCGDQPKGAARRRRGARQLGDRQAQKQIYQGKPSKGRDVSPKPLCPAKRWGLPVPLPAPAALLTGGDAPPQRPRGSSSLPLYKEAVPRLAPARPSLPCPPADWLAAHARALPAAAQGHLRPGHLSGEGQLPRPADARPRALQVGAHTAVPWRERAAINTSSWRSWRCGRRGAALLVAAAPMHAPGWPAAAASVCGGEEGMLWVRAPRGPSLHRWLPVRPLSLRAGAQHAAQHGGHRQLSAICQPL